MAIPPYVTDFVLPITGALIAGALIGVEREYRARPAGLRTHILMSLASALLMIAAVHQVRWFNDAAPGLVRMDPVRMAHGVLTGIGFLCGGVIFRERFSVHGLTTAASLWMTASLGMLYGIGFYSLAVIGTVVTLAVLVGLRWVDAYMPHQHVFDAEIRYRADSPAAERFEAFIGDLGLRAGTVGHDLGEGGQVIEISAVLHSAKAVKVEALSQRLRQDPEIVGFSLRPR